MEDLKKSIKINEISEYRNIEKKIRVFFQFFYNFFLNFWTLDNFSEIRIFRQNENMYLSKL